ncbi:unnamed protein product [Moneuplotes crassus]|uniref:Uncharacterized protein n=1 Tax=Euplotes crassus TaxID=5936 RepID=A0AAD1XEJ3_EUPCR|nr:unnamed protein product [Moneuplotes crassus]
MPSTNQPTLTVHGMFFPSNTYLTIDREFPAPGGQFSMQYWVYIFNYNNFYFLEGTINDNGNLEAILLDGFKVAGNLNQYATYRTSVNYCTSIKKGWNRVRLSSNSGVLDTKLYHKAIGEVSAGSHSNSISYSLKYKLGSTSASSNSYILYSFTFTDDDSLSTVATTALYPNSFDTCGDGTIQPISFEECDDSNTSNGDGCNEGCMLESGSCSQTPATCFDQCGDGVKGNFEECDDGNQNGSDGCDSNCILEDYFTCTQSDVSQPAQCTEDCGDGRRFNSLTTYCDDNNTVGGDGCSSDCKVEDGYKCTGGSSTQKDNCEISCGDGQLDVEEDCDDGNVNSGDGCNDSCKIEDGWICSGGSQSSESVCVRDCNIDNCQICDPQNSSKCVTCVDGYNVDKDSTCRYVKVSESAQVMSSSATAATGIGSIVGLCVSLMTLSAPMALWALANQIQLMLLLLLTKSSLPSDIISYITNNMIFSFNMEFLPIKSNMISEVPLRWMGKTQNSIELEDMGFESGSSFNNNFGFLMILCVIIVLHLILWCFPREENHLDNDCRNKMVKPSNYLWKLFTFCIYIRIFLEAYQFIFISSISELKRLNQFGLQTIVSGLFALFILIFCLIFFVLSLIKVFKEEDKDQNDKLSEFTAGLKASKHSKFYTPLLILRRIMFCIFLVLFRSLESMILVGYMLFIQIIYTSHIIYLRPMERKMNNLVECINEVFYIFFVAFLLKYNSVQEWEGWPTTCYLCAMMANTAIIVLIILVGSIISLIRKCWKKKPEKELEKIEVKQIPRRNLELFASNNVMVSDVSVNRTSSRVTSKSLNRENPPSRDSSAGPIGSARLGQNRKIVPVNNQHQIPK